MKYLAFILTITSLLFVTISCEDDSENPNAKKLGGTFTATADGELISLTKNSIYIYSGILQYEVTGDAKYFKFSISEGIAETSYDLSVSDVRVEYHGGYIGQSGLLTITEIDEEKKTMSGTLVATLDNGSESIDLTDGVFTDVPYVIQQEGTGNTVFAKVDGTEFKGREGSHSFSGDGFQIDFENGTKIIQVGCVFTDSQTEYQITGADEGIYLRFIDGYETYKATSGTIVITSHNQQTKTVTGTYAGTLERMPVGGNAVTITEGTFSYTYN